MKHLVLAAVVIVWAVALGQTQTHYLAALMLAAIHADRVRPRRPADGTGGDGSAGA